MNPSTHEAGGTRGDRVELINVGDAPVDLRGLVIEDLDGPARGPFLDAADVNADYGVLEPGEICVVFFRWQGANPYLPPADAEVFRKIYGLDVLSYTALEHTEFSDFDDQAVLLSGEEILDALAWSNRDGSCTATEASNLETLIAAGAWSGLPASSPQVARDYLRDDWTASPDNEYEILAIDFGFVAGSEFGSIQRRRVGSSFSEGPGGADRPEDFVVSNDTNFGDPTPEGQSFTPHPVPELLITEVAPNVRMGNNTGDTVEIYNAGSVAVDLHEVVLSDLDPGGVEEDLPGEEPPIIGDDIGAGQVLLEPGQIAVVVCVDSRVSPQPQPMETSYGYLIYLPSGSPFNIEGDQVVLLDRDGGDIIDSLVYLNEDRSSFTSPDSIRDMVQDTDALTLNHGGFGFVLDEETAWLGPDDFKGQTVDTVLDALAPYAVSFPFGFADGGSIQRRSNASGFIRGAPDGPAQFECLPETSWGLLPGDAFGVTLFMPAIYFRPGMRCSLTADVSNPGPSASGLPFFVVLDVHGVYYFWDAWTQEPDYWELTVNHGHTIYVVIPEFTWPAISTSASGLRFIAALTDPAITTILGEYDIWEFAFGP